MKKKLNSFMKIAEAAEFLGVAVNTLRSWADDRKVRMFRNPANGYRLFSQEDLEEFLAKVQAQGATHKRKAGD